MEELVKYIVSNLVDDESSVEVSTKQDGDYDVITVAVPDNEIGKVIGKNGKIAQSIRAIVRSASSKTGKKYAVKIGGKTVETIDETIETVAETVEEESDGE